MQVLSAMAGEDLMASMFGGWSNEDQKNNWREGRPAQVDKYTVGDADISCARDYVHNQAKA